MEFSLESGNNGFVKRGGVFFSVFFAFIVFLFSPAQVYAYSPFYLSPTEIHIALQRKTGWYGNYYYRAGEKQRGLQKIDDTWYIFDKYTGLNTGESGNCIYLGGFRKEKGSSQVRFFFSLNGKDFHRIAGSRNLEALFSAENSRENDSENTAPLVEDIYYMYTEGSDGVSFFTSDNMTDWTYGGEINTEGYSAYDVSIKTVLKSDTENEIQALFNYGGEYKKSFNYIKTVYEDTTVWYRITSSVPELYQTTNPFGGELPTHMAEKVVGDYAINAGTSSHYPVFAQNGWTKERYNPERPWYDTILLSGDELICYENGTDISVLKSEEPTWCVGGFDALIVNGKKQRHLISQPEYGYSAYENTVLNKKPRTFIGQLRNGRFFFGVVAGRGEDGNSKGFDYEGLYDFAVERIAPLSDIRLLFNLDGGGTSAFIYKGQKLNSHYTDDREERPCNSIFVFRN